MSARLLLYEVCTVSGTLARCDADTDKLCILASGAVLFLCHVQFPMIFQSLTCTELRSGSPAKTEVLPLAFLCFRLPNSRHFNPSALLQKATSVHTDLVDVEVCKKNFYGRDREGEMRRGMPGAALGAWWLRVN